MSHASRPRRPERRPWMTLALVLAMIVPVLGLSCEFFGSTTVTLSSAVSPVGAGTITSVPAGPTYAKGSAAVLSAVPAAGYRFLRWIGDTSATSQACVIDMGGDRSVVAVFKAIDDATWDLALSVYPDASGSVASSPSGASQEDGSLVTLQATAAAGYSFDHWELDSSGTTNPGYLRMDGDKTVRAVFRATGTAKTWGTPLGISSNSGVVSTIAGVADVVAAFDGKGQGPLFNQPSGAVTAGGFLYVADYANNRIRRMDLATKTVTVFSGNGNAACVDGVAAAASFFGPIDICTDGSSLYVTEIGSHSIRQVSLSDGSVVTIAGNGAAGYADYSTGTSAAFNNPYGICYKAGSPGSLFVADYSNNRIRQVSLASPYAVTTFAGSGAQDTVDDTGVAAAFNAPLDIVGDGSGFYVSDQIGQHIRYVTAGGVVTTVAGSGGAAWADGNGTHASFYWPRGLAFDTTNGILYIADENNAAIRRLDAATGEVTTLAGGLAGWADGQGLSARFNSPRGICLSSDDSTLYVADANNHVVRSVDLSAGNKGLVSTLAGAHGLGGFANGVGVGALLAGPMGICAEGDWLYFTEYDSALIRKLQISTAVVTTVAGSSGGAMDGFGSSAQFNQPFGIEKDGNWLYVCDAYNNAVRRVSLVSGEVQTFAGTLGQPGARDGIGQDARFSGPRFIVKLGACLYVTDTGNQLIRKIHIETGEVSTLAGAPGLTGITDGTGADARFSSPLGITTDGARLYVCDYGNNVVRAIDPDTGKVTLFAGAKQFGNHVDDIGILARFRGPVGITCDGESLYVTDFDANDLRRVTLNDATVTTVAGLDVTPGTADGTGSDARFDRPYGIATDGTSLFICDRSNHVIRKVD